MPRGRKKREEPKEIDTRTPEEILDEMDRLDIEIAASKAELRKLLMECLVRDEKEEDASIDQLVD